MKVAVVTSTSPYRKAMFDLTFPNMIEYCNRHGYHANVLFLEDGDWAYKKHERFKELFEDGYDLVAYRDDDILFTNQSLPYETFVDDEHDFYITEDCGGINGGSLIIRNSEYGRWLNEFILNQRGKFPNEQDAINFHYNNVKSLKHDGVYDYFSSGFKILPHPSINSYKYENYKEFPERIGREDLGDWREGHFLLHLPAMTIEKRIEIIKNTPIIK